MNTSLTFTIHCAIHRVAPKENHIVLTIKRLKVVLFECEAMLSCDQPPGINLLLAIGKSHETIHDYQRSCHHVAEVIVRFKLCQTLM